jgi:hypothetical protein
MNLYIKGITLSLNIWKVLEDENKIEKKLKNYV